MKTLLLDVDGVIADCASAVHKFAQTLVKQPLLGPEHWTQWEFEAAMYLTPEEAGCFAAWAPYGKFPRNIKLYPGAALQILELKTLFDCVFVTSPWRGNKHWVVAREELLAPFDLPVIFTSEKHRVIGDILVDDKAATIEKGGPWRGFIYDRPWNQESRMPRIQSLDELKRLV